VAVSTYGNGDIEIRDTTLTFFREPRRILQVQLETLNTKLVIGRV